MATREETDAGCSLFAAGFALGAFIMLCLIAIIDRCTPNENMIRVQNEAVDRGYATFKTDGKTITFEWVEK